MERRRTTHRPAWEAVRGSVPLHVRFLGRDGPRLPERLDEYLTPAPGTISWLRQVHSARVHDAAPGGAGEGDGLVSRAGGMALAIATADCVPVLFAAPGCVAAAHAGWRGLVEGVIAATLERLDVDPATTEVWLGPAIGPCCYEVGDDVAARLADASTHQVVSTPPGGKPHVDLHAAAAHQLRALGAERIHRIELCTRCNPELLWSYRRDGPAAGRNWSVIWRES